MKPPRFSWPRSERWAAALLLAFAPVAVQPQPAPVKPAGVALSGLTAERARYDLSFKGIGAAEATIDYQPGSSGRISARIDTRRLTGLLFAIHNLYQVEVDTATGLPIRMHKSVHQSNIEQELRVTWERSEPRAHSDQGASWPVQPGALELFSMLFRLRQLSPQPGDSVTFPLDIESQSWIARGVVGQGENFNGPAGRMETRRLTLFFHSDSSVAARAWKTDLLTNRIARPEGELTIHLGPPPANLPVLLHFGPAGSRVTMRLKAYEKGE